jgi:hypothetical protein
LPEVDHPDQAETTSSITHLDARRFLHRENLEISNPDPEINRQNFPLATQPFTDRHLGGPRVLSTRTVNFPDTTAAAARRIAGKKLSRKQAVEVSHYQM